MTVSISLKIAARSSRTHAECLLLHRIDGAETERREEPAARHRSERREFLGQHDRVAAGQDHHRHAELQVLRAAGAVRHRDERIGGLAGDPLGEPQRIEVEPFEFVDEHAVRLVVEVGAGAETESDANFHRASVGPRTTGPPTGAWRSADERVAALHAAGLHPAGSEPDDDDRDHDRRLRDVAGQRGTDRDRARRRSTRSRRAGERQSRCGGEVPRRHSYPSGVPRSRVRYAS